MTCSRAAAREFDLEHFTPPEMGGNSGYQAVRLALSMNASRVYLLGFDMQRTDGKAHWHADYPAGMGNAQPVDSWRLRMDRMASPVPIINLTRSTALTSFPRQSPETALVDNIQRPAAVTE